MFIFSYFCVQCGVAVFKVLGFMDVNVIVLKKGLFSFFEHGLCSPASPDLERFISLWLKDFPRFLTL